MRVSNLTLNIAWQITSDRCLLNNFYKLADRHHYIYFTHQPFIYSYPIFGKCWPNGKNCEFHEVTTCCKICGQEPDRNFAGYGTMILQRSGPGARMDLVCLEHVSGSLFNQNLFAEKQLKLF